ncbi:MAG TPA: class I SAM-dependent methyltransferase [Acidobacteriota bacterium]|nr:class I SAM-dependent methyltransferase [Acidobacteriota bacterium]
MRLEPLFCPVCRSGSAFAIRAEAALSGKNDYSLEECLDCGSRFLNPFPEDPVLADFYTHSYYGSDWYKQLGKGMAFARCELVSIEPGVFLDIGCGLGHFMEGIRRHSRWQVRGVEFSSVSADFARLRLGLDVRHGALSECGFDRNSIDYVRVNNVLEHVRNPRDFLLECRRILKPGGTLFLSIPNGPVDSRNLETFYRQEKTGAVSCHGHLVFFHPRALLRLLEECGFRMQRSYSYGIRRGLKSLGLYPRTGKWKEMYRPRPRATGDDAPGDVRLAPGKNRPDWYYVYRHTLARFKRVPGLRSFALDYLLYLK